MSLYEKMLNISEDDLENSIKKAILKTQEELEYFPKKKTCKFYNSYLYKNLKENHVLVKMINTLDLNSEYEHIFLIIPDEEDCYIADMTFSQFNYESPFLDGLYNYGYQKVSEEPLNLYLDLVLTKREKEYTFLELIDNNFHSEVRKER